LSSACSYPFGIPVLMLSTTIVLSVPILSLIRLKKYHYHSIKNYLFIESSYKWSIDVLTDMYLHLNASFQKLNKFRSYRWYMMDFGVFEHR
jgi:hypothetical protein